LATVSPQPWREIDAHATHIIRKILSTASSLLTNAYDDTNTIMLSMLIVDMQIKEKSEREREFITLSIQQIQ